MPPDGAVQPEVVSSAAFPTGEVTFLFSDIEGSTQRWETHRDAMQTAVLRHERIVADAIRRHGGYVFKMLGDAFCAAFHTAGDAVAAAIDAQRSLAAEDFSAVDGLRVRMGLHTGHADERNADYYGPVVNRVARLMSLGHGGQVLLSDAAQMLVRPRMPDGVELLDLRTHRLKDLNEPEHVWQLAIGGLPAAFPPLRSLDAQPNNLPVQRTSFIGRSRDVVEVKELLESHRLLTLVGSGGVGKTRLALQAGADLLDRFPDGVWLADLAPIGASELIGSVVAGVVGMPERKGRSVEEALPEWLKRKRLLLILDNCEHVLDAAASLADAIARQASDVHILSTSRQALGTSGEQVLRLASLEVPDATTPVTAATATGFGAIALFVDRASLADSAFALTDDTAPIVAEICRRLDGIPLAIELAAARVKVLSIPNLARRLNDRFKILTGGDRTALPRQKTLVALIDWSYDLLDPREKTLFGRLGVFAGSASLDAISAVCADAGADEIETLDVLSSLADKSLIVADVAGRQERYRMLESTRAYALDKLAEKGHRERIARRHAEYFRGQADAADGRYGRQSVFAWFDEVEPDLDNFRAAMDWAASQGNDPELGAAIAGSLGQLWWRGGRIAEGRYWLEPAIERVDEAKHPAVVSRAWRALCSLYSAKRMQTAAENAVRLAEAAGDRRGAAMSRTQLAWAFFQTGHVEQAEQISRHALADLTELNDDRGLANCYLQLGSFVSTRGALAEDPHLISEARDHFARSLAIFSRLNNEVGAASVLTNLAELEFRDGRHEAALRLNSEALESYGRYRRDALSIAILHVNGVVYRIAIGQLEQARAEALVALRMAHQFQDVFIITIALQHAALILALEAAAEPAARLLGYADAQFARLEYHRETTEMWSFDQLVSALRERLEAADIDRLRAEGATWTEQRALEEALQRLADAP